MVRLLLLALLAFTGLHCAERVPEPTAPARPTSTANTPAQQAPPPYEAVGGLLLPALYAQAPPGVLARADLPGLATVLAVPAQGKVMGIPAAAPAQWNRTPDHLFEEAREHLGQRPALTFQSMKLGAGVTLKAAVGEDPFVASQALRLEHLDGCVGRHGALVALPTRHHLLCYPIEDQKVTLAVQFLPVVARRLHAAGPGALTEKMYLYRQGRMVEIPYRIDSSGFGLLPPREFTEMLRELPRAKDRTP